MIYKINAIQKRLNGKSGKRGTNKKKQGLNTLSSTICKYNIAEQSKLLSFKSHIKQRSSTLFHNY